MTGKTFKIILADDHTLFREGIKALLLTEPDFEIVAEAEDGFAAIRLSQELEPDLMLIDLSMPKMNGIEAIRQIRKSSQEMKILVVTAYDEEEMILAAIKDGADGYVLKDASHSELLVAIQSILSGRRYISSSISDTIITGYLDGKKAREVTSSLESLTRQEKIIIKLVAEGYRNKEIADELCISEKTVKKHRANLMKKLDLHNVSSITAFSIKHGIIGRDILQKKPLKTLKGPAGLD